MNIFDIPVHPAADVFPMLDADELAELAADIAENGLRSPLVVLGLNGDMQLIDGRNRREACRIAKVEPAHVQLEGDAVAFIVSANMRRHMTKGARTMAMAKIFPEPQKGKRKASSLLSKDLNSGELSKARLVLKVLPELGDQVIKGDVTLGEAYAKAVEEQAGYNTVSKQMERLKVSAPDLHELVQAGKMPINEAAAASRERERQETERKHQLRMTVFHCLRDALQGLEAFATGDYGKLEDFFSIKDRADFDRFFPQPGELKKFQKSIALGVQRVQSLIKTLGEDYEL